jgi:hypothetical protein
MGAAEGAGAAARGSDSRIGVDLSKMSSGESFFKVVTGTKAARKAKGPGKGDKSRAEPQAA